MATIEIKDKKGKVVGKHSVADAVATTSTDVKKGTVHRVVVTELANARQGTQSAKTRSEVRGGGRKPYKQKKTGNARQGTTRAPHWAHGGMALAVKPRSYAKKVNVKERRLATIAAFASQVEAGNVVIADAISFAAPKTKDAKAFLSALGVADAKRVLVVLTEHDEATFKSFRNLPGVEVRTAPNREGKGEPFSTRDLLLAHKIVISQDALKKAEATWTGQEAKA
ncbi:MAG: 50S ribosomal protein L4 [Armatimonadetes bacterium]|nr:50S ribosomal protein L4 [Armatimonadota bacterium]